VIGRVEIGVTAGMSSGYVTQNGAAIADEPAADGTVADPDRVAYLDGHFRAAHRAISDGVDLRGCGR
jgi:beta-glucosidase